MLRSVATTIAQATGRHQVHLLFQYGIRSLLQVEEGHFAVQGLDAGHTAVVCAFAHVWAVRSADFRLSDMRVIPAQ
jgi:hypothetical protein